MHSHFSSDSGSDDDYNYHHDLSGAGSDSATTTTTAMMRHDDLVRAVAIDGDVLVSGSYDATIKVSAER